MLKRLDYLDETECYLNDEKRLEVAWELLSYAQRLYHRVYVFRNFEAFAKSFHQDPKPEVYWEGLSGEKQIDLIKMSTAFENYNKAVLLAQGYIVHQIGKGRNRLLADKQSEEPILISEFMEANGFIKNEHSTELYLDGLAKDFRTISFGRTLKTRYQEVVGLNAKFVNYLAGINRERNRLHFYKNYPGAFRVETYLENLKYARDYGAEMLKSQIDDVVRKQRLLEH